VLFKKLSRDKQVVLFVVLDLLLEGRQRNALKEELFGHLVESRSYVDSGRVNEYFKLVKYSPRSFSDNHVLVP
jgi:hypothetical protein